MAKGSKGGKVVQPRASGTSKQTEKGQLGPFASPTPPVKKPGK